MKRQANQGSFLALSLIVALVIAILALSASSVISWSTKQTVYVENMDHVYRLAETGLNDALQRLSKDPRVDDFDTTPVSVPEEQGLYQNTVYLATIPANPIYYVVTSATRTISGKNYCCTLHTYARVTNSSEYFLAVPDAVTVSHPVNIDLGKIYASTITFLLDGLPGDQTLVKRAEYQNVCYTQLGGINTVWDGTHKDKVLISDPISGDPVQLSEGLIIPDLLDSDMARFQAWAGPHTATGTFSGDIYPPGFEGADTFAFPSTDYYAAAAAPGHSNRNPDHVYYYSGDMSIEGTVHGQVLFVSGGNIYISSSLVVATDAFFPGAGFPSSSTAHQAVLITRGNVIIQNSLTVPPVGTITEKIQAFILAPTGQLIPQVYDASSESRLALDFQGSLILSTLQSNPRITSVFQASRKYSYMDSLSTNPPPYIPCVVDIYYSLEQSHGPEGSL